MINYLLLNLLFKENKVKSLSHQIFIIIALILFMRTAQADIIDANEAYDNKDFTTAFNEYQELSKLGNETAIYNSAVMLMNGEGVAIDLIKAYAWSSLLNDENKPEWNNLTKTLHQQFNQEQRAQAETMASEFRSLYGSESIYAKLAPITYQEKESSTKEHEFDIKILERKAPRYPMTALRNGNQGWVRLGFYVYPDGSARDFYVIESVPEGMFDEVSINAVSQFKFDVNYKQGIEPYPIQSRQTIQYELNVSDETSLAKSYNEHLEKLEKLAKKGHPDAQYYYALAASSRSMINKYVELDDVSVNEWLLKAAQNGNHDAQYQLGQNILSGKGCKVEKQKGVDWLVYAADKGHAKSARQAYKMLTKSAYLNNTNKPPSHWLKKAAEGGDPESQLDYAHHLAFSTPEPESTTLISKYLKAFLKERDKNVKYYQTMAQLYILKGNPKKAEKELKKAQKMAKKLGWKI